MQQRLTSVNTCWASIKFCLVNLLLTIVGVVLLSNVICVNALTIDSQLAEAKIECFIRVALGEKLPTEESTRRVDSPSINKCERECSMDRQRCSSFSYGISAKGNGTCELSAKEILDDSPIPGTIPDPDYDIYAKRTNCNNGGGGIQDPLVTPRPRPDPIFEDFLGYGGSLSNTDVNNYENNRGPSYGDSPNQPDDYGSNSRPRPVTGYGSYSRPSSSGYGGSNDRPDDSASGSNYYGSPVNKPSGNGDTYGSTTISYGGTNKPNNAYDVKPVEENDGYPATGNKPYNDPYVTTYRPPYGPSSNSGGYGGANNYNSRPSGGSSFGSQKPNYGQRPSSGGDIYGGYTQDSAQGDRFQWHSPHGSNTNHYGGSNRPSQSNYYEGNYHGQHNYGHNYQYDYSSSEYYRPQTDYHRPSYANSNNLRPMYDSYNTYDNYGDRYNDYKKSDYSNRPLGPERPLYYQENNYRKPSFENRHSNYRPDVESQVYGQEISVSQAGRPYDRVDQRPNKKPDNGYAGYGERMPLDKPNTYGPPNKKIDGYRGNGYDNLMPDSPIYSNPKNKGSNQNNHPNDRYGSDLGFQDDKKTPSYNEINNYDKTPRPDNYDKGSYNKNNHHEYEARRPAYNENIPNYGAPDYSSKGDKGTNNNQYAGSGYQKPSGGNDFTNKGYAPGSNNKGYEIHRPVDDRIKGDNDRPDPRPSESGYNNNYKGGYDYNQNKPSTAHNAYGGSAGTGDSYYDRRKGDTGNNAKGDYGRRPSYGLNQGGLNRPDSKPEYNGGSRPGSLSACYRRVLAGKRVHDRFILRIVPCERLEDCQRHCADERRFDCETFNYRLDPSNSGKGVCELSSTPLILLDIRKDFIEDRDYDFYELDRNSAPDCSLIWPSAGGYPGQRPPQSQWRPGYNDKRYECSGCDGRRPGEGYLSGGGNRPGNDVGYYQGGDKYNNWKGWRDRDFGGRPNTPNSDRRWDRGFVPYEIAGGGHDKKGWGQYGGSYGASHNSNSYGSSYGYYGLEEDKHPNSVYPSRGVAHHGDDYDGHRKQSDHGFNYNSLGHRGGGKWQSGGHGVYGGRYGGHNEGTWQNLQGLTPSKGYGPNDGSPRPDDDDFYGPSRGFYKPYECSTRSGSGFRFNHNVVKSALTVRDVIECERFCFSDAHMKCKSYSFRYTNGPSNNCFLSDRPYPTLDLYNDVQPDRDSDIYAMNPDRSYCDKLLEPKAPGGRPGYDDNLESDCFWRYRSGKRFSNDVIKAAVNCASLAQCEEECIRITTFTCRAFSFREGPPVIGSPAENCLLSDAPASALGPDSLAPAPPCTVYERGSYGRGCEGDPFRVDSPYHRPQHSGGSRRKKPDELCYLQYDTSAKLMQLAVKFGARLPTEHDCKVLCAQKLRAGTTGVGSPSPHFRCMSFSYSSDPNIPPSRDNCLLSDIQLRDLQPGVDYVPARTHWLFAFDMFDPDCEPVGPPLIDRLPPSGSAPGSSGYSPSRPGISGPSGPSGPVGPPRRPESPDYHHHGHPEPPSTHYGAPPPRPPPSYIPSGPSGPSGPQVPSGPSGPGRPQGPSSSGPGYGDNRRNDVGFGQDTWSFFTVSGWPCRKGTRCAPNKVAGYWSCEIEGGEIGSWDYCCHPAHHCGHSKGLEYPWCYVGASREQWRPCSDHYYPYAQTGSSPAHQGGPLSAPWDPRPQNPGWDKTPPTANDRNDPQGRYPPVRPPIPERDRRPYYPENERRPYGPERRPQYPENDSPYPYDGNRPYPSDNYRPYPPERRPDRYRPDPDRDYWNNLYKNGPQSYYDDCGNPRPGFVRVPTVEKNHIKYNHNYGPDRGRPETPHWIPVRPPNSDDGPAFLDPPRPGGFGTGRQWPVSYLHKNGPPNSTYYNYDTDRRSSTTLPPNNDQTTQDAAQRRKDDTVRTKSVDDHSTDMHKTTQNTTKESIVDGTRMGRDEQGNNTNLKGDQLILISSSNAPKENDNNSEKKERFVKTKKDTRSNNENRLDDKLENFDDSVEIFTVNEPSSVSDKDAKANLERILKEEKQIEEIGKTFRRRDDPKSVIVEKRSDNEYKIKSNSFEPIDIHLGTSNRRSDKFTEYNDKVKLGLPDDSFVDSFYNFTNNARTGKTLSFPPSPDKNGNILDNIKQNNIYEARRAFAINTGTFANAVKQHHNLEFNRSVKNIPPTTESQMKSVINNGQVFYEVAPDDSFEKAKQNAHIEKVDLKDHGVTVKSNPKRTNEPNRRLGGVEPITKDEAKRLKEIESSKNKDDLTSIATSSFIKEDERYKLTHQQPPNKEHGDFKSVSNVWRNAAPRIETTTQSIRSWISDERKDQNFGTRTGTIKKVELNNYGGRNSTSSRIVRRGRRNYRFSYNPSEVRERLLGKQTSKESTESEN